MLIICRRKQLKHDEYVSAVARFRSGNPKRKKPSQSSPFLSSKKFWRTYFLPLGLTSGVFRPVHNKRKTRKALMIQSLPKRISPLKAIRLKCLDCSAGQCAEVRYCTIHDCPLYAFRQGKNPNRRRLPAPCQLAPESAVEGAFFEKERELITP